MKTKIGLNGYLFTKYDDSFICDGVHRGGTKCPVYVTFLDENWSTYKLYGKHEHEKKTKEEIKDILKSESNVDLPKEDAGRFSLIYRLFFIHTQRKNLIIFCLNDLI